MSFILQGHRGARGLFPENTVQGFRAAAGLGVTWFELDVGVLRDGTVVVHHDIALNPDIARGLNGGWLHGSPPALRRMDWEELQDYDVGRIRPGSAYAERYGSQVPQDGARVPALAEVLAIGPGLRWNIELKLQPDRPDWTVPAEEMVERTLAVVDAAGAADRVVIQSFDWRAPRYSRRIRPEVPTGFLTSAETAADPALWWGIAPPAPLPAAVAAEGGAYWTPYWEDLTQEQLGAAQALGLKVVPWTVNDEAAMARLIGWGVDGLITDWPDRALPLLAGR